MVTLMTLAVLAYVLLLSAVTPADPHPRPPLRVGILHSHTGRLAQAEKPLNDATVMAIDEINAQGGLLGRKVVPILADGRSSRRVFAKETERLLTRGGVQVIFGGYESAARRSMIPVVERNGGLLFYPAVYEGGESSRRVVYTGATPNQYITPAIQWFLDNGARTFFLVGSDYIYPRVSLALVHSQLMSSGGRVLGEEYLLPRSRDVKGTVLRIHKTEPDVIVSALAGDTNGPFFSALRSGDADAQRIPTLNLVADEWELRSLEARRKSGAFVAGDYVAANYFESLPDHVNQTFVREFKRRYGVPHVSDTVAAAYAGVHLWARAVRAAGNTSPEAVLRSVRGASVKAPGGTVYADRQNRHLWKRARVGRIRLDGRIEPVWSSEAVIRPAPYSPYRSKQEWDSLVSYLYQGWGKRWERKPGGPKLPLESRPGAP
ncbi:MULTISPECIES: urea ABC transporter substrate-binding protein [unclassified Streptomyces]|uniref:urea ABC transporter substrate-binding protein n=2 Tax=Streptomyces TaxID=1883 RepID=UPI002DDA9539|nr:MULTISPECIES: urea ABC transporter substrate-binding protein [unclassified Streptomyces]WSA92562.1 urea ABC transporter substrate-binding protein [Streptomyces sp. NBC_01795]WSB76929.1 urea ABC transporter substrate-binding protein [Streptomyces sp. NBC_01775]WSS43632.1 urea ABC transporter substrate-binding protein [Streptomyces sp. NBC_01187]